MTAQERIDRFWYLDRKLSATLYLTEDERRDIVAEMKELTNCIDTRKYEVTFRAQGTRRDVGICLTINSHRLLTDKQQIALVLHFYVGRLVRIISLTQI